MVIEQKRNTMVLWRTIGILCIVVFGASQTRAQHVLEYTSNKRKLVKLVDDKTITVYYKEWPDTINGKTKGVLKSDLRNYYPVAPDQVDSMFAVISSEQEKVAEAEAQKEIERKNRKYKFGGSVAVQTLFSNIRFDYGAYVTYGIEIENKYSMMFGIGYIKANQGIGYIYTNRLPLFIKVNKNIAEISPQVKVYGVAELGYHYVLSGKFDTSRDRDKESFYSDYTPEQLNNHIYAGVGAGIVMKKRYFAEVRYINSGNNVNYPVTERMNLLDINVGIRL